MVSFGEVAMACVAMVASVGSLAFVSVVLYLHYQHRKYSHIPGPKRTSFFLGCISEISKQTDKGELFEDVITDWSDQYGPVVSFWFMNRCLVFFFDVQAVRELLVLGSLTYAKGWTYDWTSFLYGIRFLGQGLLTEKNHEVWHKRRLIFNPAFNRNYLKTCISQFNASSDLLVGSLRQRADGKTPCCLLDDLSKATIDIIAKVAFGVDFHQFDPEKIKPFHADFALALNGVNTQFDEPWNTYNPLKREYRSQVRRAIGNLRETGQTIIRQQMSALSRGEDLGNNILSFILQAGSLSPSGGLDVEEMVDEFVTFFLAGNETTANLLASTMFHLGKNPEVMYRLKTEVDAVIGDKEVIPYEDLSKLEYMLAVLKETLRLSPPVTDTTRTSIKDTVVSDCKIPANTTISVSFYALGRSGRYWDNPLEFIPDRFLDSDKRSSGAFIPFAVGPRNCIGQQFALIEARVLLAKLLQNFNFSLVPDQSLKFVLEATLKPKDGCQVYISPRENASMPTPSSAQ